ncbi:oxidoreductase, molybdopterin binding protein [Pyrobaculum islandicum DSM 4184]|uniref:Oxidoreductase, molybdopterin binding protein n=1 Tax=Pyrobaculum islandicum (strain DSM 4184 / JCM 9189 / GEO3) TaxID=384616 RepID=A1RU96_PYRIL|nr:oxidoreductase, molybdopterin binding protein [Pyrobaculum islandicum DSM 4184]
MRLGASPPPAVSLPASGPRPSIWRLASRRLPGLLGAPLKSLLEETKPYGQYALAWGADGYSASLPLDALMEEATIVAWALNGEPLPKKQGAPARLVVPTRYAWKSVRYFAAVEVLTEPVPGYWEMQGYSLNADPWREERFDFGRPVMRGRRVSIS